jgi:hypothetical protein
MPCYTVGVCVRTKPGRRAEGVEEDLEGREDDLAEQVIEEQQLDTCGQVRVDAVLIEVLVVLDVELLRRV